MARIRYSLRSWLWRVSIHQEVDEEIAFHIEMRARELIARGVDPKEARAIVVARLGDVSRLRRRCVDLGRKRDREMRITRWIEELRDDVTGALRQMKAAPGFAAVAALTLALGIGANSAIFALADATFLRSLPYGAPADRLVLLWDRYPNGNLTMATPLDADDWTEQNTTFDAMAAFSAGLVTVTGPDGTPEQVGLQAVTARFFDVLGVAPIAGRTFVPADSAPDVVVISEGFWRSRLGGDPSVIGRSIALGGRSQTVVGVVPGDFQLVPANILGAGGRSPSVWTLLERPRAGAPGMRTSHIVMVVGRIKAGVPFDVAQRDLTAIGKRHEALFPETNKGHQPTLQPLREALIGTEFRLTSLLLVGVVGFVLLMCCANVANLLLARTAARGRELAMRSALGATRRRVVSQLLTESLVLAGAGGLAGLAVGWAILQAAPSLVPPGLLPNSVTLSFDGRVVAFAVVASLGVGVLFGIAPAWQATGTSLVEVLTSGSRGTTRGGRLRSVLVVGEVATAVLVLCGAGLMLRTLMALQSVDPGYRAQDVLTMMIALPFPAPNAASRYSSPEQLRQFYRSVEEELAGVPGVRAVGVGSSLPLDGGWFGQGFDIQGDAAKPPASRDTALYHMVSPTFFETLEIPLVKGRAFTDADSADASPVCIVSEAFVRRFLGGREPLGMKLIVPAISRSTDASRTLARPPVREIVGVVRQVKTRPNETDPVAQLYVPLAQNPWYMASIGVRPSSGPAEALVPAVKAAIARVDKDQPVTRVRTIEVVASEATARPRFRAVLVGTFAALGLALAMVGVFGVLTYSVQQRVREFGVRMAIGAGVREVLRLVLGGAARLTLAGLVIGLGAAALLSRWLATLVFPVSPLDPVTFATVPLVIVVTAAIAVAAPAIRATRVDPVVAFRSE